MDQEFEKNVDDIPKLEINTTATREHVGDIECAIRTVKELSHTVVSYQTFAVLPNQW